MFDGNADDAHLGDARAASAYRRSGIRMSRGRVRASGVFAMPVLPDYFASHQWLRELKRRGVRTFIGVYFRIPDEEIVLVGRGRHGSDLAGLPQESGRMIRSVLGVVAGYLVFAVSAFSMFRLSGRDPHRAQDLAFVAFSIVSGVAFAFAGGYVAGVIAGRRPRLHGGLVAIIIALGAAASILAQPGPGSKWSQGAALAFMAPAAVVGGVVRGRSQIS